MTKHLLWEEYTQQFPNRSYSYPQYCMLYQQWQKKQKRSMRQHHKAGEKLFVDYAGQTIPIVQHDTGEIQFAQIFVAVMGASNLTYAEATWSQRLSRTSILSMVFKLAQSAEKRWRKLRGFKLLADVIDGVVFVDGEKQKAENLDNKDRMSA